jgi:predicted GNAT superfamily acetyltransferase
MRTSTVTAAAQARRVAEIAAGRAGVTTTEVEQMAELRQVSDLWEQVWGRNDAGVPINSELLRSLAHAGGAVTVAHDRDGTLVGAAAMVLGGDATTYSLIAGTRPTATDRGIGHALKLRQRSWSLDRGLTSMRWTFDPLVGRNARFNLTKLGAEAADYVERFYGRMADDINAGDADRLVALWRLDSREAVTASEGTAAEPREPDLAIGPIVVGPDGHPAYTVVDGGAWCRVPRDVVALRRTDPDATAAWRRLVREAFADAFARGLSATGMTRSGWYHFSPGGSA